MSDLPAARRRGALAYQDIPVPLPCGQVTTQPSLVAIMTAALGLTGCERVLETGTCCGWETAVSVERQPDLVAEARRRLTA
ncbi:hypothetical protein OG594_38195 [Streptomyces sp. NBC_01214]|uniref:protein-L-isoaspartate O-methyltransferase family protein n=1 Tax=Streptomyces sp. NBC_01214 TaxID=2903777 RepID=UPI00225BF565|nr:hypothetical protein [Streptomyces sp. NBC_01214]MCX4807384.1 hypothetical protein [Streptomyces sp. NBC_01214]